MLHTTWLTDWLLDWLTNCQIDKLFAFASVSASAGDNGALKRQLRYHTTCRHMGIVAVAVAEDAALKTMNEDNNNNNSTIYNNNNNTSTVPGEAFHAHQMHWHWTIARNVVVHMTSAQIVVLPVPVTSYQLPDFQYQYQYRYSYHLPSCPTIRQPGSWPGQSESLHLKSRAAFWSSQKTHNVYFEMPQLKYTLK